MSKEAVEVDKIYCTDCLDFMKDMPDNKAMNVKFTIAPEIAKQLVGDDKALVGAAKFIWCEHENKTLFGGITKGNISQEKSNWNLSVGTLIWVPCKNFTWKNGLCGWSVEDLLREGLHPRYWQALKGLDEQGS